MAQRLSDLLSEAAAQIPQLAEHFEATVQPAGNARFGDYQANGVLPVAKRQKLNPRELATKLHEALVALPAWAELDCQVEVAGPGFLNFTLGAETQRAWLLAYGDAEAYRRGAGGILAGKKVVVDYPSPNTAKQMHIGHLRPMVIGEAIARLIEFCGATVVRDNHIGDWGTNFGTLIREIKTQQIDLDQLPENPLAEIERLYKEGTAREKDAPETRELAREELAKLQQGDAENLGLWQRMVELSTEAFEVTYARMGVRPDVTLGESFYRDKVERIYQELTEAGLAEPWEGALVVWHDEVPMYHREAERKCPFIIRKQDGASNYASTDLATALYRVEEFAADSLVYITDDRQQDHFKQLFLTTRKWFEAKGYRLPELHHVFFGKILGEDKKPIKTRSGESVKLCELLDEAVSRAHALLADRDFTEEERGLVAEAVGLGAIKYADLSSNRTQDYVFSWERLLSFEGNTAPYLQYAGARIHSIFRKAGLDPQTTDFAGASAPETAEERALARQLLLWPAALRQALPEFRPHHLCTYLYELAGAYSTFYNANHVMVDEDDVKLRRLLLCARTLSTLECGLRLLAIEPLQRM